MQTMHLFAGGGGGLLADLILGHTPIVAVEWDGYACQVLRERAAEGWFPGLHVWEGDVRMFDPSEYAGKVDCIHAGFPCQPFSVAGKRKGSTDERGELFSEVVRCIEAIRPKYVFLENVPGLLTSKSPSCICGWPYRRGGMSEDSQTKQENNIDIYGDCPAKHVEQSKSHRGTDGRDIRRESLRSKVSKPEMVGSVAMAYQRGCRQQLRDADSPILDVETKTGGFDSSTPLPEGIPTIPEEWSEGMVPGSEGTSCSHQGHDAHAESEGTDCPRCGRRLVSDESGFVWYMESILWTLAALGYDSEWLCLRASDCGANHQRDRWWLLATYANCSDGSAEQERQYKRAEKFIGNSSWKMGSNVAYSDSTQCQGMCSSVGSGTEHSNTSFCGWWETEPDVGRVANGVPNRVHRLKGLGNAQVPLQAAVAWKLLGGP